MRPKRPEPERSDRCRGERGTVGGVEAIPFGLLLFVAGTLLIANAWAVIDAKMGTSTAAREASRFLVESNGDAGGAIAVGNTAFENQVGTLERLSSDISIAGLGPGPDSFVRCARVTVTYTYETPVVSIPFIGGWGSGIDVTSTHSELVDPLRGGLGEESVC